MELLVATTLHDRAERELQGSAVFRQRRARCITFFGTFHETAKVVNSLFGET